MTPLLCALLLGSVTDPMRSLSDFGVSPRNSATENAAKLQAAIDWASPRGEALYLEPSPTPYEVDGGIVLRANVSLVGPHGPVGRGTVNPTGKHPVGAVFAIRNREKPFLTVESATQLRGLQFWYPEQTLSDPGKVIPYPPTIQVSQTAPAQGVTLSCLTFYGEFFAMDFRAAAAHPCEQILVEHCYGYPLGGTFVAIDRCYDIPRILHCHANPANMRLFAGGFAKPVIDSVVARGTFAYAIDRTDNAVLMDVFTFGTYGGAWLGPATYGQLTGFNFDCVTIGVQKSGDGPFNRNWQLSQGSIIANTGPSLDRVHPFVVEGKGHLSIGNVEAFSGANGALTTLDQSQDFLVVRGDERCTVSLFGCRMRNYAADAPLTLLNPNATVRAVACVDKDEKPFER
ncbi:MAG: hypothetical protein KIS66_03605 [Fimbriimonadaceae bacterium]|nr:hypothetical protein [Fimbriimonadaceae bacterium]